MKYHKLYVGRSKSFELKEEKLIVLPCAKKTHSKFILCRVFFLHTANYRLCRVPKRRHTAKHGFSLCFFKPSVVVVAHDKMALCRVSDRKHTTNNETHSKLEFSGSVYRSGYGSWNHRLNNNPSEVRFFLL